MAIDGRAARGGVTKELILDSAMDLFKAAGLRATSVRDIAAHAGITHPGLLYHFATKEALLMAVLQRRDDAGGGSVGFHFLDGRSVLQHLVAKAAKNATERGIVELFANLSVEAAAPDHPAHDYFVERYAELRATIVAGLEELASADALRADVSPAIAAVHLIALMDGLQVQWLLDPETDMPGALRIYVNSLLTEPL
jgi:AcrR family transcriptional regulator